jgi:predicted translin family RNA/ssDNA-binding protein
MCPDRWQAQIEAISFFHYLEHRQVISMAAVAQRLGACGVHITEEDYLCGLADLTGARARVEHIGR